MSKFEDSFADFYASDRVAKLRFATPLIASDETTYTFRAPALVQMARRLLMHMGVSGPRVGQGRAGSPNEMRCVMAALYLAIAVLVAFSGPIGGKAGW